MRTCILFFLILGFGALISVAQQANVIAYDSHTGASFRAVSVVDDQVAWVAGSDGWFGRTKDEGESWEFDKIRLFGDKDFRTLFAFDALNAVVANAGSPAYILRTHDGGENWLPIYQNSDPEIFLDGVDFWNENEGVIYGDPIDGKMTLLVTHDGGYSWEALDENYLPKMDSGEASFAASGTAIRCFEDHKLLIATGGLKSRLFYSENRGRDWQSIETPIRQGSPSEGIFSIAVNHENLVIVGGDFTKEEETGEHIFISTNFGRKWKEPKIPTNGYREAIEYLDEEVLISCGPSGAELSGDGGQTWVSIPDLKNMHAVRKARMGSLLIAAGRDGILNRIEIKK